MSAQNARSATQMRYQSIGQVADPAPACARPRGKRRPSLLDPRPVVECLDCGNRYRWTPRPDICLCGAPLHDGWRSLPAILWDIAAREVARVDLRRFW
jgi:hypothetical protein